MSSDDDRIEEALARLLETRTKGSSIAIEAILAEHPGLEEPLRARLRVFQMLDALRSPQPGDRERPSVLESLSRAGTDIRPVCLDEPGGEAPLPATRPHALSCSWGRYAVQGEIARGGVGVVLKAHDPDLGRDVALKTLREEYASRPDVLQRFVEEAQIGGQLQHPGVVPVYELGMAGHGHPYFAMQLVKGRTLAHVLGERALPSDDLARLLSVFQAICQTVAYAQERGIVHRDLKPSNVMVGAFGEVQVFDWGMAKILARGGAADDARTAGVEDGETASSVRTVRSASGSVPSVEGSVLGTPQYMAPEQARGELDLLDERADVFSLGAILCEILTGKPPYTGPDRDVLVAAAEARLAPAQERLRSSGADAELVALAVRCLAPDRTSRPRDAGVLAREITAHMASLAERARKAEVAAGEARVLVAEERRARRLTVSLSAAVAAFLLLGGGGLTWLVAERRERTAVVDRHVGEALAEATRLRGRAETLGVEEALPLWREAQATVRRAEALATSEDADEATRTRAASAAAALAGAEDRAKLTAEEQRNDDAMARRLDEIRVLSGETSRWEETSTACARAFRDCLGAELEALEPGEAARRIGASRIRDRLVLALDFWVSVRERLRSDRTLLAEVLANVDTDPWRVELRKSRGKLPSLRALAARTDLGTLNTQDAIRLADALGRAGDPAGAASLALETWHRHPGDFWACLNCAAWHRLSPPPKTREALRFSTAAVAVRPRAPAAITILGGLRHEEGDVDGAIEEFRQALRVDPRFVRAHYWLGLALSGKGDRGAAIASYREAIRLDPAQWEPHTNLGLALEAGGDIDGAIASHREAIRLDPTQSPPHTNLGLALEAGGDVDGAIAEHRLAIHLDATNGVAHLNLGSVLFERKRDLAAAIAEYREAIRLAPKLAGAHLSLGSALETKRDFDGAIKAHREALRLDPTLAKAHTGLGMSLLKKGDVPAAISAGREATRLDPGLRGAHTLLARALRAQGNLDGALEECLVAVRLEPTHSGTRLDLGVVLYEKSDFGGALRELREAARLDPKDALARVNLATVLLVTGEHDAAIAESREANRLDPTLAVAHFLAGKALNEKGDRAAAAVELKKAIELDPRNALSHSALSEILLSLADLGGAVSEAREALRLAPTHAIMAYNLGILLRMARDPQGATAAFREAVRLDSRAAKAYEKLGATLSDDLRDFHGALLALREAIRLDPGSAMAHHYLGAVLMNLGDVNGAIAECHEALRLDPLAPDTYVNLGGALRARGQLQESLEAFRKAHELGSRQAGWQHPSALEVEKAQRLVTASARLGAFVRGKAQPSSAQDAIDLAMAGYYTAAYGAASMIWERTFALMPALAENLTAGHRYDAACVAALAGAGKGTDAATIDDTSRARMRRQAVEWLRADLEAWMRVTDAKTVSARLNHWKKDADLAGIRDAAELAKASAQDREACRGLWREVDEVLRKLEHGK